MQVDSSRHVSMGAARGDLSDRDIHVPILKFSNKRHTHIFPDMPCAFPIGKNVDSMDIPG